MPRDTHDDISVDPQDALRLLDEARSRVRMVIWALHGMHQDMNVLVSEDLSDAEHILTEVLENALNPGVDTLTELLGVSPAESIITH